jgi:hypothetical protein
MSKISYSKVKMNNMFRLDNEDALIHLCYHNYWHAQTLQSAFYCMDMFLKLYTDIRLLIKNKTVDWSKVWSRAKSMKVSLPVQYTLYFCHVIFGDVLTARELENIMIDDVIAESKTIRDRWITNTEEKIGEYQSSFEERLFDQNRILQALSAVNLRKYYNSNTAPYIEMFFPLVDNKQN